MSFKVAREEGLGAEAEDETISKQKYQDEQKP